MKAAEALQVPVRGAEVWPLSVEPYHALGEAGLVPERTELLYGLVYHKRSKLRAYASAGVRECWLVLGREKQIEVHCQPREGQFAERALHGPGGRLTSTAIPRFTVDLSKLLEPA